jgi:uncharacterized membrane protein (DUF106 family)
MDYTIIMVALVALGITLLTQLINKLLINEKYVDGARVRMKEIQGQLKTITDIKSKEFTQMQDELLDTNFKIMKQQMKPMILTFLPYIFIYWLLAAAFAYTPIMVGSDVTVRITPNGHGLVVADCLGINNTFTSYNESVYTVNSGTCQLHLNNDTSNLTLEGKKEIVSQNAGGIDFQIVPPKNKIIPLPVSLPYVGDGLGWLGTFIIFSLIFSLLLTKALKGKYLRKWE